MDKLGELFGIKGKPSDKERGGTGSSETFGVVGAQDVDSLGSTSWRKYQNPDQLQNAWSPSSESPWAKYQKTKSVSLLGKLWARIKPRYSEGEDRSQRGIHNLTRNGVLGQETAIILDSGGPHSVAMAANLVDEGYQPVIMFDDQDADHAKQELATMLYHAEEMNKGKLKGKIKSSAPPAFVMDCHRERLDIGKNGKLEKKGYSYREQDLPSVEELKKQGIKQVVHVNEGDQQGNINSDFQSIKRVPEDLKKTIQKYEKAGIKVVYTGVKPWEDQHNNRRDFGIPDKFDWDR